ncbi:hypothetical protein LK09_18940 [Microbacterium mangrovi]|uniref:Lipoprotein n=1 Tax=Microbacterium mangrovi TaxID=1348253 RepID=A0A0B1ZW89_9MICO|nr:hypothetical protein [Microbacterium mangrovi]KHK95473.1 hypothetical protein LK09_18940 [Microbacterium mangrovi]
MKPKIALRAAASTIAVCGTVALAGCASTSPAGAGPHDPANAGYIASQAKSIARSLDLTHPPKVDLIRFVTPAEWAQTQVQCMKKAGFQAGLTTDGEGVSNPPASSDEMEHQLRLAMYRCEVQYLTAPKYETPLTSAQLHRLYRYRSTDLVRCLERLGHDPAEKAPSESVFVESGGAWTPYASAGIPDSDLRHTTLTCPQTPADLYG